MGAGLIAGPSSDDDDGYRRLIAGGYRRPVAGPFRIANHHPSCTSSTVMLDSKYPARNHAKNVVVELRRLGVQGRVGPMHASLMSGRDPASIRTCYQSF